MNDDTTPMPPLRDLGFDLLDVSRTQRLMTLAYPFLWCAAYFVLALNGFWPLAIISLMGLSFTTYGSTSHDLVHHNLRLSRRTNDFLLCVIELLAIRSGHAYQAAHLHHHARYPHDDDVEAKAARMTFVGALLEGIVFPVRINVWALRNAPHRRGWIVAELIACVVWLAAAPLSPIIAVYVATLLMGGWIIPLMTSYLPHAPNAATELTQTRLFRGKVASLLAFEHLYHLEHHLYPAVPHTNWPKLAKRLDPYFENAGVKPTAF